MQLKIENYYFDKLDFNYCTASVIVESNDKEFFIKCREIRNKIIELMDIDHPNDFVIIDDYGDEFIVLDIEKIQALLEINIEIILYLLLQVLLIMYFKHH